MHLSATIRNTAFEDLKGTLKWKIESDTWLTDQRELFSEKTKPQRLSAETSHKVAFHFKPPAAGFYQVTCTFSQDGDDSVV